MTELPITEQTAGRPVPELDARAIPHKIRHAAVLGVVGSLGPGQAFVLAAPHDPLPLLKQINQAHGDDISVDYLERGPEAWRLQLTRQGATGS